MSVVYLCVVRHLMKPVVVSTFLTLTIVFFGCKTSQNDSFIKAKKEKRIVLAEVESPHILFLLETGDTLKLSSRETSSLLEKQIRNETKRQGYLSNQDLNILSEILKRIGNDTLVIEKLSTVDNKTIGGVLDTWIARELMLKGKVQVALKDQLDQHPVGFAHK